MTENTTALTTPHERWITLDAAGKKLGYSRRTVERLCKAGLLATRPGKPAGARQLTRVVHSKAVTQLKHDIENGVVSIEWNKSNQPAKPEKGENEAVLRRDAVTVATSPRVVRFAEVSHDPWLTVEEAATYARLPAAYLRRIVESGELHARNVLSNTDGNGTHKSWRIKRSAVDDLPTQDPNSASWGQAVKLSESDLLGLGRSDC